MEYQRARLLQESTPPMSQAQLEQKHHSLLERMFVTELDMLDGLFEEQVHLQGRLLKKDPNSHIGLKFRMNKLVAKVNDKSDRSSQQQAKRRESSAARHYKSATNQLIKGLKALG
jgi:hypothetical protein